MIKQYNFNYVSSNNLSQVIYLQKKIKYFLKRKKAHKLNHLSNKNNKQAKNKHWNNKGNNDEKNLIMNNHNSQYSYHTKKSFSKLKTLRVVVYVKILLQNQIKMLVLQKINLLKIYLIKINPLKIKLLKILHQKTKKLIHFQKKIKLKQFVMRKKKI